MTRGNATLAAAILGTSTVFLDTTVVNVALKQIGQDLPSARFGVLEGQSYIYNGYLLSLSALLILAGALADRYGRRRVFAIGLAGFGVTSLLCGIAPSLEALIVLRIAQGAAGALLVPGSLALLTAEFEGVALGRALGWWAAASSATSIVGPVVGGLLVDTVSWRAVFFLNVPFLLAALWATRYVAESRDPDARGSFDWLGAATVAIAVGGLSFGAIYGQQHEWRDAIGPAAIAVGAVASVLFVVLMATRRRPLVPLSLFRSRNFAVTNLMTFLVYGALYVYAYEQAIFSQGTLGYSAAAAGFVGIASSILLIALSTRVGAVAARFGPRRFMAVGPAVMALGALWLARIPAGSAPWQLRPGDPATYLPPRDFFVDLLPAGILFGLGLGIMVAPLTTALMSSVPGRRAGLGSAINNALSRVGPQLAGAVVFVAITAAFYANIAARLPGVDTTRAAFRLAVAPLNATPASAGAAVVDAARSASTDAFHLAMLIVAALLFLGAAVSAVGIQDAPARARAARPTRSPDVLAEDDTGAVA